MSPAGGGFALCTRLGLEVCYVHILSVARCSGSVLLLLGLGPNLCSGLRLAVVCCSFHSVIECDSQYPYVGDEVHAQVIYSAFPSSDSQGL